MSSKTSETTDHIYRITFFNRGEIYELFARTITQGGLFGFIEVEELLFGERSQLVIDPGEERLRTEFEGVRRTYIPMHSVVRIDEVPKQGGGGRILSDGDGKGESKGKVTPFPMAMPPNFKPPGKDS